MRGGAGNFGIVTSLKFQTYRLPHLVAGSLTYPMAQARDVFRAYREAIGDSPDELTTYVGSLTSNTGPVFIIYGCFCGDPKEADKVLKPLRSIGKPLSDDFHSMTYAEDNAPLPSGFEYYSTGIFCPDLTDTVIDGYLSRLADSPPYYQSLFVHYHGAVTRVPQHETAFPFRRHGFSVFIVSGWRSPSNPALANEWSARLRGAIGANDAGGYVNDVGDESDARVRAAFGPNYDRLVALKRKCDPTNSFRMNQNIKPA